MGGRGGSSGREWPGGGSAGGMTWDLKTPEVNLIEKGPRGPWHVEQGTRGASRDRGGHVEPLGRNFL